MKSIFIAIVFSCAFRLATAQQVKLCCPCVAAGGQRFVAETVPSLPNACPIACSSNGGKARRESPWTVPKDNSCPAMAPSPANQKPIPTNIVADIKYSVGHQGAVIWAAGRGDEMLHGEDLKKSLIGVDMNSATMRATPAAELERAVPEAMNQCKAERDITADFVWVCRHEQKGGEIRARASEGNFNAIRSIFSLTQSDHDDYRNKLYCRNNAEIAQLVRAQCP